MIKVSELPQLTADKIDVDAVLKEIEKDALSHKLDMDGRNYEVTYDVEGIKKIKKVLLESGFDVLANLTGYKHGQRCVTLFVSIKRQ